MEQDERDEAIPRPDPEASRKILEEQAKRREEYAKSKATLDPDGTRSSDTSEDSARWWTSTRDEV